MSLLSGFSDSKKGLDVNMYNALSLHLQLFFFFFLSSNATNNLCCPLFLVQIYLVFGRKESVGRQNEGKRKKTREQWSGMWNGVRPGSHCSN